MSEHIIKLVAEKNLNKFTYPVINIKGKRTNYPYSINWNQKVFICKKGLFGSKERMLMDIFGTLTMHSAYNQVTEFEPIFLRRIPTSNDPNVKKASNLFISKKLLDWFFYEKERDPWNDTIAPGYFGGSNYSIPIAVDGRNQRMKKPRTLYFSDTFLKKQLPFLKKYSSKRILEMIERTSECEFQFDYPIRFYDGEKYQNYNWFIPNCGSRLFNLVNVVETKKSRDNKILERSYEIHFDTFLGYFYMQNILSCYTDLVPYHFYEMSDYAQLFYRLLILPYYNGVKIPISLEEIRVRLALKSESFMCRKIVSRILDELESNRFIAAPKEIKPYGHYCYQYKKNDWKTIIQGD
jgi:hypothetical protein